MSSKKLFAFSLIILTLAITISAVSANENITSADDISKKTFTDISKIIEDASENDEIIINETYVSEGNEIKIKKAITIRGENNAVLDGNKTSPILSSTKGLVLKDLTIINSINGGIISSGSLTLINCTIKDNSGVDSIIKSIGKLNISDCVFENNNAKNVIYADSDLEIEHSKFINNPAEKVMLVELKTIVKNCEFTSNRNVLVTSVSGFDLKVCNSKFDKNKNGILIEEMYGDLTVDVCNFTRNTNYAIYTLTNSKISNTNFTENKYAFKSATPRGESYEIPQANTAIFENCLVKSNTAGGIITDNNLVIKNTLFDANHGAIISKNSDSGNTIKISNSRFENNWAEYAGSIKAQGSVVTVTGTTFKNNSKANIIITSVCAKTMEGEKYYNIAKITVNSNTYTRSANLDNELNPIEIAKVTAKKLTTTYLSGAKLQVKVINKLTKQPVKSSKLTLKVYTGKKYKNYEATTDKNGVARFSPSFLSVGSHKVEITSEFGLCKIPKTTTTVKVSKAKTIVKAPKLTAKYKKSKYFKISVKNKATKKASKNLVLKVKIDKKTYKIKTNTKGIAKFNTKILKYGKHKVTITSANANYYVQAKSSITIR